MRHAALNNLGDMDIVHKIVGYEKNLERPYDGQCYQKDLSTVQDTEREIGGKV